MYRQWEKNLLNSNTSSTCLHNMVNFGPLTAEIGWPVWDTCANFNGFRVLTALLHGTAEVGVSQTLRRWTEGATYIRQGDHHVGHWSTFLVLFFSSSFVLKWFVRPRVRTSYIIRFHCDTGLLQYNNSHSQVNTNRRHVQSLPKTPGKLN